LDFEFFAEKAKISPVTDYARFSDKLKTGALASFHAKS
jgi:hypothetical protein